MFPLIVSSSSSSRLRLLTSLRRQRATAGVVSNLNLQNNDVLPTSSSSATATADKRHRLFSSSTKPQNQSNHKNPVVIALYRQLLRWCQSTDPRIPLAHYIPPVHLQAPQIDAEALMILKNDNDDDSIQQLLPSTAMIHNHDDGTTLQLTCPIQNSTDVRDLFRAMFRLHSKSTTKDDQKQRITTAFEALKSLNELTEALDVLQQHRIQHSNRQGVQFRVGQVVRHVREEWRGVIVGWERLSSSSSTTPNTSLTQKTYDKNPVENDDSQQQQASSSTDRIRYSILLDSGDAHMHYTKRREPGDLSSAQVHQPDLVLVDDLTLCRIRSTYSSQHFERFDSETKRFVPNAMKLYEFPADFEEEETGDRQIQPSLLSPDVESAAKSVITGVQNLAHHLKDMILGGRSSAPELEQLKLLSFVLRRVEELSMGNVTTTKEKIQYPNREAIPADKLATFHLRALLNLTVEVGELLWQRKTTLESKVQTKFNVGDIVEHKRYGFRGVVVAWDPKPLVDVSRWDGLQDIENPQNYPFYHIIPDQNDCIEAFGGERPSRYVCEENLVSCPGDRRRRLQIDLQSPEWVFDDQSLTYKAPEDLKFKFGVDLGDDGVTSQVLEDLQGVLARVLTSARDNHSTGVHSLDETAKNLSMDNLMNLLQSADSMDDATTISECIKEIWKSHRSNDVRWRFDTAVNQMLNGETEKALVTFGELVDEDQSYAEAWNKASTCEFMNGNMDGAVVSAQKALELMPTHYQAMNGLGLIHFENKDLAGAIELFEKSMEIDPWSPVAARLLSCRDTLDSRKGGAMMGENQEWKFN